jgi:hypothetical protein
VRAQQFELMQAIFRSSLWIQVLAFSHPFLRLPIHPAGSDRRDPHALPVCVWGLPKNPVRSFQLSCIVTLRPVELSRKTSPQSTKPRDEFDASRQRRDPSERSDPRNLWSRRSDRAYAVMVAPKLTDAQRASLTAICDAAFRDDGEEALQELLAVVPEPTDEQRENCEFAPSPALQDATSLTTNHRIQSMPSPAPSLAICPGRSTLS